MKPYLVGLATGLTPEPIPESPSVVVNSEHQNEVHSSQTNMQVTDPPVNSEQENDVHSSHGLPSIAASEVIKVGESAVLYLPAFVPDPEGWYERLAGMPWSPEEIMMYGKNLTLKRQTINYGDGYDYNPNAKVALPWSDGPVLQLKKLLETATSRTVTQCACNLYPDGGTVIGVHHDKRNPILIASLSFGDERQMGFCRHGKDNDKKTPTDRIDKKLPMVTLAPGSLLLFTNEFNDRYKHGLAPSKSLAPRISVTFRQFAAARAAQI
jgi:alkylated DNA repair dioxygenase AlkB